MGGPRRNRRYHPPPGRTLIEKLLRVNNFAVRDDARDDIHGWPRIGRQFYDIWALLGHQSVIDLLNDRDTVTAILDSVAQVSAQFTPDEPVPADGFAASSAFDPDGPLAARLEEQHDIAINDLYYGDLSSAPSFTEVTARIHEHAALLDMSPTQPAA